jgi:hypothetical protein
MYMYGFYDTSNTGTAGSAEPFRERGMSSSIPTTVVGSQQVVQATLLVACLRFAKCVPFVPENST